jgi:hypothetical protein
MGNTIISISDENEGRESLSSERFQEQFQEYQSNIVYGKFNYKVEQRNTSREYNYEIALDLNDTKENIVSSLNRQIRVDVPGQDMNVDMGAGDLLGEQRDPTLKGYFQLDETTMKIAFVLPTRSSSVILIDNQEINRMPSIFPFLGMPIKKYKTSKTRQINVEISTNKDITLLKHNASKIRQKIDEVKYSENLEKTRRLLRLKDLSSNVTTNNVNILEYTESLYVRYLRYLKTILIILVSIMLIYYLTADKNWSYITVATVVGFLLYCIV